jgi:hypothetical protein
MFRVTDPGMTCVFKPFPKNEDENRCTFSFHNNKEEAIAFALIWVNLLFIK